MYLINRGINPFIISNTIYINIDCYYNYNFYLYNVNISYSEIQKINNIISPHIASIVDFIKAYELSNNTTVAATGTPVNELHGNAYWNAVYANGGGGAKISGGGGIKEYEHKWYDFIAAIRYIKGRFDEHGLNVEFNFLDDLGHNINITV